MTPPDGALRVVSGPLTDRDKEVLSREREIAGPGDDVCTMPDGFKRPKGVISLIPGINHRR